MNRFYVMFFFLFSLIITVVSPSANENFSFSIFYINRQLVFILNLFFFCLFFIGILAQWFLFWLNCVYFLQIFPILCTFRAHLVIFLATFILVAPNISFYVLLIRLICDFVYFYSLFLLLVLFSSNVGIVCPLSIDCNKFDKYMWSRVHW